MTYTTGTPWGRKTGFGTSHRAEAPRDKTEELKAAHLSRLQNPLTPIKALRAVVGIAGKRRYSVSVLMDDGSILDQDHFASSEVYLEDICARFARGTLISTAQNKVAVEDLRPGDKIKTRDNGIRTLRWIGSCAFGGPKTASDVTGYPIRIKADALGDMRPDQDLLVSPRFRVLSNHASCAALFGSPETLAPAIDLMDDETIMQVRPPEDLLFYNLMLDNHQIIQANGLDTESYHPGNFGVSVMTLEMQHHMRQILPHLDGDLSRFGRTVRPILKGFEAEVLRVG